MLNRRQIDVQHRNLSAMCRITVKSLIDYACVNTHVDEDCEEFVNFCAVFEQMVSHRLRPYQKKVWHRGQAAPRHFWELMLESHRRGPLFRSCIPNIAAIENIKSHRAKLRAFVRVALMEKRLSDYLYWLQNNRSLMTECYLDGALFVSEEGIELCGDIIGLSAIDFNFCLKGNENELLGPFEINYAPFLNHTQSSASRLIDEEEMLQLSGKAMNDRDATELFSEDKIKLASLEMDFRRAKEQKDYLEELVRLRERQMGEAHTRVEISKKSMQAMEKDWEAEKRILDVCVLELQDEVTNLRNQNTLLKQQISELQLFKSNLDFRDVPMVDMALVPIPPLQEESSDEKKDGRPQAVAMLPIQDSSSQMSSDQRSILSGISDQIRLKEDSQSLVPLTGSLADVNIAMIRDNQQGVEESHDGWRKSDYESSKYRCGDLELILFQTDKESDKDVTATTATSSPSVTSPQTAAASSKTSDSMSTPSPSATVTPGQDVNVTPLSRLEESFVLTEAENGADADGTTEAKTVSSKVEEEAEETTTTTHVTDDQVDKSQDEIEKKCDDTECRATSDASGAENISQNAISQALQDLGKAFDQDDPEMQKNDPLQVMSDSNSSHGDSNGNELDDVNTSSMSEPEILDKVNVSSEGSDAAWEMLSDAEEPESNAKPPEK